ncbi:MAG: iron-sulfur cluster assembly scaffold protein [Gammaproteobacteria bacterium]
MSIEQLYTAPIRQLAREGRVPAKVPQATARATVLSNRFCGDEVRLGIRVKEGLVQEIACTLRACVLCEASAQIMRRAMLGKDEFSLAQAERFLCRLAEGVSAPPPAGWEELGKFEPLRRFKSRLDCVLLPLCALRQALSDAPPSSTDLSAT